jgi:hypothetical protein
MPETGRCSNADRSVEESHGGKLNFNRRRVNYKSKCGLKKATHFFKNSLKRLQNKNMSGGGDGRSREGRKGDPLMQNRVYDRTQERVQQLELVNC